MTEATTVPVRDAATVMLLRDTPQLQVLMLRRNPDSAFVANAHVFPGGAVDTHDHLEHPVWPDHGDDMSGPPRLSGLHGVPAESDESVGGAATVELPRSGPDDGPELRVAAIRETFEESGVLLARGRSGVPIDLATPACSERFARHRLDVDAGRRTFAEVLVEEGIALDLPSLRYVSRWVTPEGAPRRYDTRFYVAPAPRGQEPSPDAREAVASEWVEPGEMLRRWARDEVELILPTVSSLELLAPYRSVDDVLADADRAEVGLAASGDPGRG